MKYPLAMVMIGMQLMAGWSFVPRSMAVSAIFQNDLQASHSPRLAFQEKISQLVVFPEVALAIPKPAGFEKATSFYGFQQPSTGSSIMLSVIPGPLAEVTRGFNKKGLAAKGISLISRQAIQIGKQPGFLLQVSQFAGGQKFLKWIVVFGDQQKTNIVTATFLHTNSAKLSASLKKTVLAVLPHRSTSPAVSRLPFVLTPVAGLISVQKVAGLGKIAVFTKDGKIPNSSPADPLFIVAPSLGDLVVDDQKAFATRRLFRYPQTDVVTIISSKAIKIGNLSGWEILANGRDQKTKTALKLYQVMLFPKQGGYVVMTGLVGEQETSVYLPKFKAIALSYSNRNLTTIED